MTSPALRTAALESSLDPVHAFKRSAGFGQAILPTSRVPEVPVTSFRLDLAGGAKDLLQNSRSLCESRKKETVEMVGQSGKRTGLRARLRTACGARARYKRHRLHRRAARVLRPKKAA